MWIDASNPAAAPWNDINLLDTLNLYEKIDAKVGNVALNKLLNLWYLSDELIVLSLFDAKCQQKLKRKMSLQS